MAHTKSNLARGTAAELWNVVSGQAIDIRVDAASLHEIQALLTRLAGLDPALTAALVAMAADCLRTKIGVWR
jgi:hypothetical protein